MKTFVVQLLFLGLGLVFSTSLCAQDTDQSAIRSILDKQASAWSNGDLEAFMQDYWKSDSLTYFSRGSITKGWETTLNKYKKGYPSKAHTGQLTFKIAQLTQISENAYYVMGEYFLTRKVGNAHGTFMIIFKKIDGEWKIIADSSC
ncbi:YybH family protein [Pseudozobellia thermophila]|uniref:DUF4440 domain-containing protein n=1 Tax=Pseudozobellia thermophila TaxID=192903 RepID=A0A1M6F3C3_9FLAO|nr:nuclear transport factor 2 family protein [Pseudozobellia thermophila]SHI92234.1 protein of unknown function [Pseudozobellia thermophila]